MSVNVEELRLAIKNDAKTQKEMSEVYHRLKLIRDEEKRKQVEAFKRLMRRLINPQPSEVKAWRTER